MFRQLAEFLGQFNQRVLCVNLPSFIGQLDADFCVISPVSRIDELMPWTWVAERSASKLAA